MAGWRTLTSEPASASVIARQTNRYLLQGFVDCRRAPPVGGRGSDPVAVAVTMAQSDSSGRDSGRGQPATGGAATIRHSSAPVSVGDSDF